MEMIKELITVVEEQIFKVDEWDGTLLLLAVGATEMNSKLITYRGDNSDLSKNPICRVFL